MIPILDSEIGSRINSMDPHFPFVVKIKHTGRDFWTEEIADWLHASIGKNHKEWEWWFCDREKGWLFEFKDEGDRVLFTLRWL